MLVLGQIRVGLEFVLCVSTILSYHYRASTWLRLQSFGICLDNEPRVETPFCENLVRTQLLMDGPDFLSYVEKGTII